LWLSLALAAAPLQVAAAPERADDAAPCHVVSDTQHAPSDHSHHVHGAQEACPQCENCPQHDCVKDGCAPGVGSVLHLQPAVIAFLDFAYLLHSAPKRFVSDSALVTRTEPPPLRPPL
jgi:hypothetical protein